MMKRSLIFVTLLGLGLCMPQSPAEETPAPAEDAPVADAPAEGEIDIITRAQSTFQNCDCQCDSYTWTSNGKVLGNCLR